MLLQMVQLSLDGKYLVKGYSDLEYDLATVVYELGGGHCLTALQKSPFAFPSRNALFEHNRSTTRRLCRLHCLLMFIIILTSSHKLMFFIKKPYLLNYLSSVK
jgi:hypothetical protein